MTLNGPIHFDLDQRAVTRRAVPERLKIRSRSASMLWHCALWGVGGKMRENLAALWDPRGPLWTLESPHGPLEILISNFQGHGKKRKTKTTKNRGLKAEKSE
ncbi:uncharacterized protein LOC143182478 [Calliopsis andreniformis]|uniref:uncharacterized protein LOC143182478 n=1 Tax=Calliopsis andreniformis TaxID=337506 RepID=UPI003FCDB6C3